MVDNVSTTGSPQAGRRGRALAGAAAGGLGADRRPDRQAAPAGVVRQLRHQRRDALGRRARPGLPDRPSALLRPQPHEHADDRRRDVAAARVRDRRPAAARALLPPAREARLRQRDRVHRVRRQRPQLLRHPAGHAGVRHAVEARGDRRRALARRTAARRARARRPQALGRRRAARRARRRVRERRRQLRPRAPAAAGRQGARRRADRARDERQGRCRPTTASRRGWSCPAGSASRTSSGSVRSRSPTPALSTPFNTTFYPGLTAPERQERVRAGLGRSGRGAAAAQVLHGRSWSGHAPIRKVEVSTDGGASWRRARLHGPNLRNAWVALGAAVDAAARAATSCSPAPPTAAGSRSPTRSSSTAPATGSGPSCATR